MVNGLKLIEEHQAEFANVFGVVLIVLEAAAETARCDAASGARPRCSDAAPCGKKLRARFPEADLRGCQHWE